MILRRFAASVMIVAFVVASVACGCGAGVASAAQAEVQGGCHGAQQRGPDDADRSSADSQLDCPHCGITQLEITTETAASQSAYGLHVVLGEAFADRAAVPARASLAIRGGPPRGTPCPLYLLHRVFRI
jgi:hypothetical protein